MLTPDFLGVEEDALHTVIGARPDVFNHNIETVAACIAGCAAARRATTALWLLRRAKEIADYNVLTKSGIIVGLGETNDEVVETLRDLRAHGVDVVTIGQYLQPSPKHATIDRGCTPTSSAGSASRARRSASAPSSPARSCARATAPTSSATRPRPAAAQSRTDESADPGVDREVHDRDAAARYDDGGRRAVHPTRRKRHDIASGWQRDVVATVLSGST